jgi:hypothetical protein
MIDASAVRRRARAAAGELVVPAIMLLCIAVYWSDAAGLSAEALSFPLALTAVLGVAIVAVAVMAFLSARADGPKCPEAPVGKAVDRRLAVKTWLIVALPVPLIYFWNDLGAIAVFFVYSTCVLFVLGERSLLWLIALPAVLAFGLVYLFKVGLYVRLPDFPSVFSG